MSEGRHEPTPRRLKKALEAGDGPISQGFVPLLPLVAFGLGLPFLATATKNAASEILDRALAPHVGGIPPFDDGPGKVLGPLFQTWATSLGALGLATMVLLSLQTGGRVRFAPFARGSRPLGESFRSGRRWLATLRGLSVAVIAVAVAGPVLVDHLGDLAHLMVHDSPSAAPWIAMARSVIARLVVVGLGASLLDFILTRRAFRRRLRMTDAEKKQEERETSSPLAPRWERHRQVQAARAAAELDWNEVTLLLRAPWGGCVAVRYAPDDGDRSPLVLAACSGPEGQRWVREAEGHSIPVLERPDLVRVLSDRSPREPIPEEYWAPVGQALTEGRSLRPPAEPSSRAESSPKTRPLA